MLPPVHVPRKIVAMIPAFNEERTIASVVERTRPFVDAVVVVNDGSSDATVSEAERAGAIVVSHSQNEGLGRAFRTGIGKALAVGASVIVTLDADGQFTPEEVPKLVDPIEDGSHDMVTGTRFSQETFRGDMRRIKSFGNAVFTRFVNRLTGTRLTDAQCGFRAYSREAAMNLTLLGRFTYTQEVILNLATKGFRIGEVPVHVRGQREHGQSKMVKSPLRYGLRALSIILRAERDYKPLRFFGSIGSLFLVLGALQLAIVVANYLLTKQTSPYTSLFITGGSCVLIAVQVYILALVADGQARSRQLQDELLVLARRRELAALNASTQEPTKP